MTAVDPKATFGNSMKSGAFRPTAWLGAVIGLALVTVAQPVVASDSPEENDSIDTSKNAEMAEWTFDQAENVACITVRQVIDQGAPILLVFHDKDDHGWQFLSGGPVSEDDAMVVSMRQIVEHDPTLLEIGAMPPGYRATRKSVGDPWHIEAYVD